MTSLAAIENVTDTGFDLWVYPGDPDQTVSVFGDFVSRGRRDDVYAIAEARLLQAGRTVIGPWEPRGTGRWVAPVG